MMGVPVEVRQREIRQIEWRTDRDREEKAT